MTPLPDIASISEEATGCINEEAVVAINEAAIGDIIAPRNPPSFFISCFSVSTVPSIKTPDFSSDYTILIISSISSFEINNVNRFPALTAPLALIFV